MKESSTRLDEYKSKHAFLTLVKWHPYQDAGYSGSDEIGVRTAQDFELIQWNDLPTRTVWPVVKKLSDKGRTTKQICKVIEWLEGRL